MTNLMKRNGFYPMMNQSLFDDVMNDFFGKSTFWTGKEKLSYPMNVIRIIENEETIAYRLEYALAGFKKEDIKISISGDILKVEATHKNNENENEIVEYNGISYKDLISSFKLMKYADKANITSKFDNGLLLITIPSKVEVEESKLIDIE